MTKKETKPTQEELSQFVAREVVICQSSLVDALLKSEDGQKMGYDYENITNLYQQNEDGQDEEPQEVFEWWIISEWLLEELEKRGEPILKTDYQNYWGRTTTGQSISIDYVIEKIYIDLHNQS